MLFGSARGGNVSLDVYFLNNSLKESIIFDNITQALSEVNKIAESPTASSFSLMVRPGVSHQVAERVWIKAIVNVSVISEAGSQATICFENELSGFSLRGEWSFHRILFVSRNVSYPKPIFELQADCSLSFRNVSLAMEATGKFSDGFIKSDWPANITFEGLHIAASHFSGYLLMLQNPRMVKLSKFVVESSTFLAGALALLKRSLSSPIYVSDVSISESNFTDFFIFSSIQSSLDISNFTARSCNFRRASSAFLFIGGSFQNFTFSVILKTISFYTSAFDSVEAISIREMDAIQIASSVTESCNFNSTGILTIVNSHEILQLFVYDNKFLYSNFEYGLSISAPSSKARIEKFLCTKNNKDSPLEIQGPCIRAAALADFLIVQAAIALNNGMRKMAGLHLIEVSSKVFIADSTLIGNLAHSSPTFGCAFVIESSSNLISVIENCTFEQNTLSSDFKGGSALFIAGNLVELFVKKCSFRANRASAYANAVYFDGHSLSIKQSDLEGNEYQDLGFSNIASSTGVLIGVINNFALADCKIIGNKGFIGNIFLVEKNWMNVEVENILFLNNEAYNGDFLYIEESTLRSNISIRNSRFEKNNNKLFGLVIFFFTPYAVKFNSVKILSVEIANNYIGDDGFFSIWVYAGPSFSYFKNCSMMDSVLGPVSSPILSFIGIKDVVMVLIEDSVIRNISSGPSAGVFSIMTTGLFVKRTTIAFCSVNYVIGILLLDENGIASFDNCLITDFGAGFAGFSLMRKSIMQIKNTVLQNAFCYYSLFEVLADSIFELNNCTIIVAIIIDPIQGFFLKIQDCNSINSIGSSQFFYILGSFLFVENTNFFIKDTTLTSYTSSLIQTYAGTNFFTRDLVLNNGECKLGGACLWNSDYSILKISSLSIHSIVLYSEGMLMLISQGFFLLNDCAIENLDKEDTEDFLFQADFVSLFRMNNLKFWGIRNAFLTLQVSAVTLSEIDIKQTNYSLLISHSLLRAENCEHFFFVNSAVSNIQSITPTGGACIALLNTSQRSANAVMKEAHIISSSFFNNSLISGSGGALYLQHYSATLVGNIFYNNKARLGGAVNLESQDFGAPIQFNVFDCILKENTAIKAGGGIYWQKIKPNLTNCSFLSNTAFGYGPDTASFPMRMTLTVDNRTADRMTGIFLTGIRPGEKINQRIEVAITDSYNQRTSSVGDTDKLDVTLVEKYPLLSLTGRLSQLLDEATSSFRLELLIPHGPVLSNLTLKFQTSALGDLSKDHFSLISAINKNEAFEKDEGGYYIFLPLTFSECQIGEIFQNGEKCVKCRRGYYSFNKSDEVCSSCPQEAECPGGAEVILKRGYWRKDRWSRNIYKCNTVLRSCAGGLDDLCSNLYEGSKCFSCLESDPDHFYQKSFAGTCVECPHPGSLFIILLLADLLFCAFLIWFSVYIELPSVPEASKVAFKVLFSNIHFLLIIQSYEISLPSYFSQYIVVSALLGQVGRFWFSMECVLKLIWRTYTIHVETLLVQLLCCSLALQAFLISKVPFVRRKMNKACHFGLGLKEFLTNSFYILLPSLIDFLYSNVTCQNLEGEWVLRKNPAEECYTPNYNLWIVLFYVPLLFFYVGFLPVKFLLEHKRKTNNIMPVLKYGSRPQKVNLLPRVDNIVTLGSKGNRLVTHDLVAFCCKVVLVMINQSEIEASLKQLFILWIIVTIVLIIDPLIRHRRSRTLHVLDFFSKVSIISLNYLLLWMTNDNSEKQSQPILFALVVFFQMSFFLLFALILLRMRLKNNAFLDKYIYSQIC